MHVDMYPEREYIPTSLPDNTIIQRYGSCSVACRTLQELLNAYLCKPNHVQQPHQLEIVKCDVPKLTSADQVLVKGISTILTPLGI